VSAIRKGFAAAVLFAAISGLAGLALADVVVLKGGTVVPLKQPWVRRGNTAYLTRTDGTLLSVPVSEIDRQATAAANQAAAAPAAPAETAPASTPAEAARATTDPANPKAKVRITDADVSHPLDLGIPEEAKPEPAAGAGGPRVEVADYTQELVNDALVIKGSLRNPGQGPAENVRMTVSAIDEKGQAIDGTTATLSKGTVGSGQSVDFTASLKVGSRTVASLRFNPQWTPPKPPPAAAPAAGQTAAAGAPSAAPAPRPTPYGRGNIWAPPVANAPSEPPPDGKTGYIPGATSPDNQPKPPSR
jgi:hypothetical protein